LYSNLKHKAATSEKAPSKLINEGLYDMGEEGRMGTKSVAAMRQKIQRERRKGKGKMPRSIKDIDVKIDSTVGCLAVYGYTGHPKSGFLYTDDLGQKIFG
jgi:hypothetical protein